MSSLDLSTWDWTDERDGSVTDGRARFRLLGPLEVRKDGRDVAPTAPKVMQLMALLLFRPGRVVTTDTIVEELWSSGPPRSVRSIVQTYVYQVRRCIEHNRLAANAEGMLVTRPSGYLLQVEPDQIDVFEFQRLCRLGRRALTERRFEDAAGMFRSALGLWTGAPLASVDCGNVLTAYVVDLQEQRRNARHLRIEAEIEGGLHRELVGELRSRVTANPLDECLHGQLMRALAGSGRRLDAMATFRALRTRLASELGVEPCGELQTLHHQLLSADEASGIR
jgi:SARP family transcriptional regulator, regulator of embCAB operon